jgi:probable phosphoglycerate mutase
MKKIIYIIRHGQTDYNKQGIVQGSGVDSSLNKVGKQQGQAFFEHYKEIPFEVVITSTLKRTQQTVQSFIDLGLRWEKFSEINEICWGDQEGKKASLDSRQTYLNVVNDWCNGKYHSRLRNAESAAEMGHRLSKFIEHLKEREEKTILVCSHGRAMRALMCLLTENELTQMEQFKHSNTGLYQFQYENGTFTMLLENDRTHREILDSL